ncbi:MAG: hypothetical protein ACOX3U_01855 [Christensenellales bacterium]|jgi:hypothetical protein
MLKNKKVKKILIITVVIVLLIGGGIFYYYKDMIFNKPQDSELGVYYGLFGYAPMTNEDSLYIDYTDRFASYNAEIQAAMAPDATAEEKALAAYIIYRVGCLADATQVMSAKYSTGEGVATGIVTLGDKEIDVSGEMKVTASYYNLKYPFIIPSSVDSIYDGTYGLYVASEEYTQIPKGGVSGSDENIVKAGEPSLRSSLPFARKTIITPDYKVVWNAITSTCVISPEKAVAEFPDKKRYFDKYTTAEIKAEEEENELVRPYDEDWGDIYGLNARDMSIHIINPDTIIGDSVVIAKHTGADIAGNSIDYYSVEFDIDTETGRGTKDSATYYSEQIYKAQAPEMFTNFLEGYYLHYSALTVKMSVFTNGYFRTFETDEVWSMGGVIKGIGSITAEITSVNKSAEAFCYDYDTIMQGYVNRYFGDNDKVNIPIETLPFYKSDLAGFTPKPYGEYR